MALLSTLSTAAGVISAMRERRMGRDPADQQAPEVVLPSLAGEIRELEDYLIALRTGLVAAEREAEGRVALVRTLSDLMLLGGFARNLHVVHQHLMSLYPAVDEDLVEDARLLHATCGRLIENSDPSHERMAAFIEKADDFLAVVRMSMPPDTLPSREE